MSLSAFYYDPFHEPLFTVSDMNRFFDAAFESRAPPSTSRELTRSEDTSKALRPRMDLHGNKENEMTATFELPGMRKEDVDIHVHNNHLVVSGQTERTEDYDEEGYAVRERRYGKFSRTLPIPSGINPEEIKADMEHGVLTVTFPKSRPEKEAKRITIS